MFLSIMQGWVPKAPFNCGKITVMNSLTTLLIIKQQMTPIFN